MTKIIGVSSDTYMRENGFRYNRLESGYTDILFEAGFIPFIIPFTTDEKDLRKLAKKLDGLVLSGGYDVSPLLYGEDITHNVKEICPLRDDYEIKLYNIFREEKKPIIGICRGMQIINTINGGTLYQDIYAQKENCIAHNYPDMDKITYHHVKLRKDDYVYKFFEDILNHENTMVVNSYHHQAVKKLASGFETIAKAKDDIIEMAIHEDKKVLLFQFHPEKLVENRKNYVDLFKDFFK